VVLYGLPAVHLHRLQSVQNAAVRHIYYILYIYIYIYIYISVKYIWARLIFGLQRTEHITDALLQLHRLHVPEGNCFKLGVLTYRVLHGGAPSYLSVFTPVSSLPGRRCLRSASSDVQPVVPLTRLSTVGDRAFLVLPFGTVFQQTSRLHVHSASFVPASNYI
jgi:hypothetical protein